MQYQVASIKDFRILGKFRRYGDAVAELRSIAGPS